MVGSGAIEFFKGQPEQRMREESFSLSRHEKEELLALARKSVETAVLHHKLYQPPQPRLQPFLEERGAFVTLTRRGHLRGCIGYVSPALPLYLAIRDAAAQAALRDPRFPEVAPAELDDLDYEISILSAMSHLRQAQEIRLGLDGLLVRDPAHTGLLLPQVAVTQHWDRIKFLEETCRKGGLPSQAWRKPETDVFRFRALVFGDRKAAEGSLSEELLCRQDSGGFLSNDEHLSQ